MCVICFYKYMMHLSKSVQKQSQRADLQVFEIQLLTNDILKFSQHRPKQ